LPKRIFCRVSPAKILRKRAVANAVAVNRVCHSLYGAPLKQHELDAGCDQAHHVQSPPPKVLSLPTTPRQCDTTAYRSTQQYMMLLALPPTKCRMVGDDKYTIEVAPSFVCCFLTKYASRHFIARRKRM